jgi:hypothetical protein
MRRRLFALVLDNLIRLLLLSLMLSAVGCASRGDAAPIPDIKHRIVFRTDSSPESLAAISPDAAKAILIARSFWEVSPHFGAGTGPFTFEVWHEGRGWGAIVYSADTKGTQIHIGADWQVSVEIST